MPYFESQHIDRVKILQLRGLLQWANEKSHDNLKQKKKLTELLSPKSIRMF